MKDLAVEMGGTVYPVVVGYTPGLLLTGPIALDTETTVEMDPRRVPTLVLGTVSDGSTTLVLSPDDLVAFVEAHWDATWVGQNLAYDYWVLANYSPKVKSILSTAVEQGRVHDTMLLDQLYRVATDGNDTGTNRNLGEIALDYLGWHVDKTDPYRTRYGEIAGKDLDEVEEGFLTYAAKDAIATVLAFKVLRELYLPLLARYPKEVHPNAVARFGPLSENIQVKASIALARVTRLGIGVDRYEAATVDRRLTDSIQSCVQTLKAIDPELFQWYKRGGMVLGKDGLPKFKLDVLRRHLGEIAARHKIEPPTTPRDGKISTVETSWARYANDEALIKVWLEFSQLRKLRQFTRDLPELDRVHSRYRTLVRTGRTSAMEPNIQQMPREPWFRRLFKASDGKLLAAIDYSYIELHTLASVCKARYGWSRLADVISEGTDPHVYTAAMFNGMSAEEFLALRDTDPKKFKADRQSAKAINFGIPGGLGVEKLVVYARETYGVVKSRDEMAALKAKLTGQVYPEIGLYLEDNSLHDLAVTVGWSDADMLSFWGENGRVHPSTFPAIRKIVGGRPWKADGTPYNEEFVAQVWRQLEVVCRGLDAYPDVKLRHAGKGLEAALFSATAYTLTGRPRAGVRYTEARNTPFQGLAADGAKIALWDLTMAGFDVVAFIHDEIVIEVVSQAQVLLAEHLILSAMNSVLHPDIKCRCETRVSERWEK